MILPMGERTIDEPSPNKRLTVAQAADHLGLTEGAVRSRIKRGTLSTERAGGTVYVVFYGDEPPPNVGELADEPSPKSADHRLIDSYEARIESLERQLAAEREAHGESRRIIAGLVQRIPELEAPPQSAQEAESVAESAMGAERHTEPQAASSEPVERRRVSWWRRIFGNRGE